MKIFGLNIESAKKKVDLKAGSKKRAEAFTNVSSGTYTPIFSWSYDGEKNLGEIGPIKNYAIDYAAVRARSWQSYLESEITKTVIDKFTTWVIGSGLKLQSEPNTAVLQGEGITINTEEFNRSIEQRWRLWNDGKRADLSNNNSLNKIAQKAFKSCKIGGDVLVILSYSKKRGIKVQLVDGGLVRQPLNTRYANEAKVRGNYMRDGIEYDKNGRHVAYYVQKPREILEFERIEAYGKNTKRRMAYMVYGGDYRLDSVRGVPLFVTVLETLAKLDRYKEATVGSAEERQKIAFSIEHGNDSTGENPLLQNLSKAINADAEDDLPVDINGYELANRVAATTNKQAINMPIGATLKMLESKNELYFKDFYTVNIGLVCAAIGIPPEVALSKYDSNFSASRAALKDWEHTLLVNRKDFADQFYSPIYELFFDVCVLENKLDAPGYLSAMASGNYMVVDSFRSHRFVGSTVPHIDPVKEVEAERRKLGSGADHIPLTSLEAAVEALNGGDINSILTRFAEERNKASELGIEPEREDNNLASE